VKSSGLLWIQPYFFLFEISLVPPFVVPSPAQCPNCPYFPHLTTPPVPPPPKVFPTLPMLYASDPPPNLPTTFETFACWTQPTEALAFQLLFFFFFSSFKYVSFESRRYPHLLHSTFYSSALANPWPPIHRIDLLPQVTHKVPASGLAAYNPNHFPTPPVTIRGGYVLPPFPTRQKSYSEPHLPFFPR